MDTLPKRLDEASLKLSGYQIMRFLGEGHNAYVYQARRLNDPGHELLVIKVFKKSYPSPAQRARLQRELAILQALNLDYHTHAVRLEEQAGLWMLVTRYEPLQSLPDWLAGQPWTLELFLNLALHLAVALEDIHRHHVMHGDLKPSNILIDPVSRQVKLTDFGMARIFQQDLASYPAGLEGTLPYISPEQTGRTNKPVDERSDFYSLGVTLFQIATGRLPFAISDRLSLIHAHLAVEPPQALAVNPALPPQLSAIIARLMLKDPEERYQTASAIRADLQRCQAAWQASQTIPTFALGSTDHHRSLAVSQKLYGREAELARLIGWLDRCGQAAPTLGIVVGEPGSGKSALIQALQPIVALLGGMFVAGKYDQLQQTMPYGALLRCLRTVLRRILREPAAVLATWRERLQAAVGDNGRAISEVLPELDHLLGIQPSIPELPPIQARSRFTMTLGALLRACGRAEQPLVLVLDDLHWADESSLDFVAELLNDPYPSHLLLIAAYRDTEVGPEHPVTRLLRKLQADGHAPEQIGLSPLDSAAVRHLLADTFQGDYAAAELDGLAAILHRKSEGNPFFLATLLQTLYDDQLLVSDPLIGWRWDLAAIERARFSGDVATLVVRKLDQLPPATADLLKHMACLGSSVSLMMLQASSGLRFETLYGQLAPAIQTGLVWEVGDEIHFVHERVRESIYGLIPAAERAHQHWQSGQRWLAAFDPPTLEEQLFAVVSQLNQGRSLADAATLPGLIALNLRTGLKARASSAFELSLSHLEISRELLPADSWQADYQQTYAIWDEALFARTLLLQHQAAFDLATALLDHVRSDLERARCYRRLLALDTWAGNYGVAIQKAEQALAFLGQRFPADPAQIAQATSEAQAYLAAQLTTTDAMLALPAMTDPSALLEVEIRYETLPAMFRTASALTALNSMQLIRLALEKGSYPALSAPFVALYGIALNQGDLAQGRFFYSFAAALWDQYPQAIATGQGIVATTLGIVLLPDLAALRQLNQHGQLICQQNSMISFWGISLAIQTLTEMMESANLAETLARAEATIKAFFDRYKVEHYRQLMIVLIESYLKPLLGVPSADLADLEQDVIARKFFFVVFNLRTCRGIVSYTLGDYPAALEHFTQANEYVFSQPSGLVNLIGNTYHALTILALGGADAPDRAAALLAKVEIFDGYCGIFRPHTAFGRAELAYVRQDPAWHSGFIGAIEQAAAAGYTLLQATIHERFAHHLLAAGHRFGRSQLEEALYLYDQCGALANVRHVQETYSLYVARSSRRAGEQSDESSSDGSSTLALNLDLYAILKAHQAIASEIDLARLLQVVMQTIGEVSGAEGAYLIMEEQGERIIKARYQTGPAAVPAEAAPPELVRGNRLISADIVRYAHRTRQTVLLEDAWQHGEFTDDPVIQDRKVRSVLCQPLLAQHNLAGLIYLENTLNSHAFTAERVEVVQLLATQAAISIMNAQAHAGLEALVAERTAELQAQASELQLTNTRLEGLLKLVRFLQHELRAYTAGLEGVAPMVRRFLTAPADSQPSPEFREQFVVELGATVSQMNTLTQQLLILTRDGVLPKQQRHLVPVLPLLEQARLDALAAAALHGLALTITVAASADLVVQGDPLYLSLALFTGLRNAVEALAEHDLADDGEINLAALSDGSHIRVRIEDNGPGFPAELLASVAAAAGSEEGLLIGWSTKRGGNGLGLPLMDRIARLHAGWLACGNRAQPSGAWVELTLPIVAQAS